MLRTIFGKQNTSRPIKDPNACTARDGTIPTSKNYNAKISTGELYSLCERHYKKIGTCSGGNPANCDIFETMH